MNPTPLHIKPIIFVLILLVNLSCSTKKKSWTNRQYHNTTAKYNGYFNGNESIKAGVKKLHKNHIDDYTTIISVFPTGNLKKSQKTNSFMITVLKMIIVISSLSAHGKKIINHG